MQLRTYQIKMIDDTRAAMQSARRVLLQAPTGAGKTAITVHMMRLAAERGARTVFCVHQNELLRQTSRALWQQQLEHGVIAAGRTYSKLPAQVASVQTLVRRLDRYQEPDLIIIDEAHRAAASTYRKVLDAWPGARVIGLTATPERSDGKGLGDVFETIVYGPQIRELIDGGYLAEYELLGPEPLVNRAELRSKMGDFDAEQAVEIVDKPKITGDAIDHYIKHASGKRCVVMCITLKHAQHVTDSYMSAGVAAEFIHGGLTDDQREAILKRFASGQTRVLCNVQLMIEGVDIPSIEVIQWLRPTKSLIVWMQGNGRGLRPSPGKSSLLILDHVGNWSQPGFGMPDDAREWSLDGRTVKERAKAETFDVRQCPMCYNVYRAHLTNCPKCHAEGKKTQREIEIIEGELKRIELDEAERQRRLERREVGMSKTLEDLIGVGIRKGMNRPAEWAANLIAARQKRRANRSDYEQARQIYTRLKTQRTTTEVF